MIEIKNLSKTFSAGGNPSRSAEGHFPDHRRRRYSTESSARAAPARVRLCAVSMCLERPTAGSVLIDGCDLNTLSEAELRKIPQTVSQ